MERVTEIAMLLLESELPLKVDDIATKLGVSNRTVRNDYGKLAELARLQGLELKTKSGVGAWISGTESAKIALIRRLQGGVQVIEPYSPRGRQDNILKWLLFGGRSTTIYNLSEELYISTATVYQDLKPVSDWLAVHGLKLKKRRNHDLAVEGEERDFRKALSSFLLRLREEQPAVPELTPFRRIDATTLSQLKDMLSIDYLELEKIINELEERLQLQLAQDAYISLLMHIVIALKRIAAGHCVPPTPELFTGILSTREYREALALSRQLEQTFGTRIPEGETVYIALHILGSKLQEKEMDGFVGGFGATPESEAALAIAADIIAVASDALHLPLQEDKALFNGLVLHLRPAMNRLKYGLTLRNPMLDEIKEQYGDIFGVAWMSCKSFTKYVDIAVPESEIGYITLHLAAAVARNLRRSRALVVCHSGIGTSQLLSERLRASFRELEISGVASASAVDARLLENIDVVISTVPFSCAKPVLLISPLFRQQDVRTVELFLEQQKIRRKQETVEILQLKPEALQRESVLLEVGAWLTRQGHVQEGFAASLLEREKLMTTEVGQGIAIPHGDATLVRKSCMVLVCLKEAIRWENEMVKVAVLPILRESEMAISRIFFRNLCREMSRPELTEILCGETEAALAMMKEMQR